MPTQLEILGQQFYKQEITRNKFTPKNEYNSNNPVGKLSNLIILLDSSKKVIS